MSDPSHDNMADSSADPQHASVKPTINLKLQFTIATLEATKCYTATKKATK